MPFVPLIGALYDHTTAQIEGSNPSTALAFAFLLVDAIPGGSGAKGGVKLLSQFNSIESLISAAGTLGRVKSGLQGFVKGDGASIFKALIQSGQLQKNGQYLLKDGTLIGSHLSTTTGKYTIHITPTTGKMIKIRIEP